MTVSKNKVMEIRISLMLITIPAVTAGFAEDVPAEKAEVVEVVEDVVVITRRMTDSVVVVLGADHDMVLPYVDDVDDEEDTVEEDSTPFEKTAILHDIYFYCYSMYNFIHCNIYNTFTTHGRLFDP